VNPRNRRRGEPIGYAVVGQGYIAQAAVLPAFAHAKRNSRLVALVSGDPVKLRELASTYGVERTYSYEEYDECLASGEVDAVYIALPNAQHCDYAVRAARAGVHVLCEKPLAVDERECRRMIDAARRHRVKLMTAYRLHFEPATLAAIEAVRRGDIGEPRLFVSSFTMNVKAPNIRLEAELGGGTLYDIGIYCINAARHLFRAEPIEVFAMQAARAQKRFDEVEESVSATLRFPGERLASFMTSFGADKTSEYRIVGTEGTLRVDPAYELADGLEHHLSHAKKTKRRAFGRTDQFAPELLHFSDCILQDREPEPSGEEGLADVRVIRALYRSARLGRPVKLGPRRAARQPGPDQSIRKPPVRRMPKLVHVSPPGG
jgi:glucose-fructose oxidoreductase